MTTVTANVIMLSTFHMLMQLQLLSKD